MLHLEGVLIVHHVFRPDDSRQVLEVGAMQPLHSTALGKVLAAYDPVARGEAVRGTREQLTARTVTDLEQFEAIVELTRSRGWATDVEETWEGVARWPRRSMTGAECRSEPSLSPVRWNGCAKAAKSARS